MVHAGDAKDSKLARSEKPEVVEIAAELKAMDDLQLIVEEVERTLDERASPKLLKTLHDRLEAARGPVMKLRHVGDAYRNLSDLDKRRCVDVLDRAQVGIDTIEERVIPPVPELPKASAPVLTEVAKSVEPVATVEAAVETRVESTPVERFSAEVESLADGFNRRLEAVAEHLEAGTANFADDELLNEVYERWSTLNTALKSKQLKDKISELAGTIKILGDIKERGRDLRAKLEGRSRAEVDELQVARFKQLSNEILAVANDAIVWRRSKENLTGEDLVTARRHALVNFLYGTEQDRKDFWSQVASQARFEPVARQLLLKVENWDRVNDRLLELDKPKESLEDKLEQVNSRLAAGLEELRDDLRFWKKSVLSVEAKQALVVDYVIGSDEATDGRMATLIVRSQIGAFKRRADELKELHQSFLRLSEEQVAQSPLLDEDLSASVEEPGTADSASRADAQIDVVQAIQAKVETAEAIESKTESRLRQVFAEISAEADRIGEFDLSRPVVEAKAELEALAALRVRAREAYPPIASAMAGEHEPGTEDLNSQAALELHDLAFELISRLGRLKELRKFVVDVEASDDARRQDAAKAKAKAKAELEAVTEEIVLPTLVADGLEDAKTAELAMTEIGTHEEWQDSFSAEIEMADQLLERVKLELQDSKVSPLTLQEALDLVGEMLTSLSEEFDEVKAAGRDVGNQEIALQFCSSDFERVQTRVQAAIGEMTKSEVAPELADSPDKKLSLVGDRAEMGVPAPEDEPELELEPEPELEPDPDTEIDLGPVLEVAPEPESLIAPAAPTDLSERPPKQQGVLEKWGQTARNAFSYIRTGWKRTIDEEIYGQLSPQELTGVERMQVKERALRITAGALGGVASAAGLALIPDLLRFTSQSYFTAQERERLNVVIKEAARKQRELHKDGFVPSEAENERLKAELEKAIDSSYISAALKRLILQGYASGETTVMETWHEDNLRIIETHVTSKISRAKVAKEALNTTVAAGVLGAWVGTGGVGGVAALGGVNLLRGGMYGLESFNNRLAEANKALARGERREASVTSVAIEGFQDWWRKLNFEGNKSTFNKGLDQAQAMATLGRVLGFSSFGVLAEAGGDVAGVVADGVRELGLDELLTNAMAAVKSYWPATVSDLYPESLIDFPVEVPPGESLNPDEIEPPVSEVPIAEPDLDLEPEPVIEPDPKPEPGPDPDIEPEPDEGPDDEEPEPELYRGSTPLGADVQGKDGFSQVLKRVILGDLDNYGYTGSNDDAAKEVFASLRSKQLANNSEVLKLWLEEKAVGKLRIFPDGSGADSGIVILDEKGIQRSVQWLKDNGFVRDAPPGSK